jgi:hypothetical protein
MLVEYLSLVFIINSGGSGMPHRRDERSGAR